MTYFHLEFPREIVTDPVVSDAILKTGASINILRARIDEMHGEMIAEVAGEDDNVRDFADYLKKRGVLIKELKESVSVHVDGCTHCGACVSVCPVRAISVDDQYRIVFDEDRCISCLVCIPVCPVKAIRAPPI